MRPFHLPTVPGPAASAPVASRLADRLSAAGFVFLALLIGLGGGVPAPAGAAEPTRAVVSYVENREGAAILEPDGDYDRFGDGGGENVEPRQMVARELYLHHADEVDLLSQRGPAFDRLHLRRRRQPAHRDRDLRLG